MSRQAAFPDVLPTAKSATAARTRAQAVTVEERLPAAETAARIIPAADSAWVTVTRTHALGAVATLAGAAALVAAGTMAARAAAVQPPRQTAEAAMHHPDAVEDGAHRVLGITPVRNRGREVGSARVHVNGRNFAGNRVADNSSLCRGRGDPSDRERGGQGQRRKRRDPSPCSETHGHSLFTFGVPSWSVGIGERWS
jgi:hypothetical protein